MDHASSVIDKFLVAKGFKYRLDNYLATDDIEMCLLNTSYPNSPGVLKIRMIRDCFKIIPAL